MKFLYNDDTETYRGREPQTSRLGYSTGQGSTGESELENRGDREKLTGTSQVSRGLHDSPLNPEVCRHFLIYRCHGICALCAW